MKRFVAGVGVSAGVVLAAVAAANAIIDPYGIFGLGERLGLRLKKPEVELYRAMYEARQAKVAAPKAIVIGTSRSDAGFDPGHPVFGGVPAYNLATPGQPMPETAAMFEVADQAQRVFFGLDFFVFNCRRFDKADLDRIHLGVLQRTKLLLSLTTLGSSAKTLTRQNIGKDGLTAWNQVGVRQETQQDYVVARGGHRVLTRMSEDDMYLRLNYAQPFGVDCGDKGRSNPMGSYRDILKLAYERGVDLRMAITPAHARQWETLRAAGLWQEWEQWKRTVLEVNQSIAKQLGREAFPIWDFSGYNAITTEPFPAEGDTQTVMRWYWESSHFRKEAGDLVLQKVFAPDAAETATQVPANFGVRLQPAMIDSHFAAVRLAREAWAANNAAEVQEIAAMADRAKAVMGQKQQ